MTAKRSYHIADRDFVLAETPAPDAIAPSESWWVEDGLDRLYVGDVIRIRQGAKQVTGRNSEGERVFKKKKIGFSRTIADLREETVVGKVYGLGLKNGTLTAYYSILYQTDDENRTSPGRSICIRDMLADNAEPAHMRQREVRRMRDSGPSQAVRDAESNVDHAARVRREYLFAAIQLIGEPALDRLFQGDQYVKNPDPVPVTDERLEAWKTGTEAIPSWAMTAVKKLLNERDIGDEVVEAAVRAPALAPVVEAPAVIRPENRRVVSDDEWCDPYNTGVTLAPRKASRPVDDDEDALVVPKEDDEDFAAFNGPDDDHMASFSIIDDRSDCLAAAEEDDDDFREAAE